MHPDRAISPDFKIIKSIHLPTPVSSKLDNGIPLHVINIGEQPVVRLEIIFEGGGNWYEVDKGTSYFGIKMLSEGTKKRTASEISEDFDRIGAFLELTHSFDKAAIVVYCLSRFLPEVLPIVQELIEEATFPEKEFDELRNITIQNLRVSNEKTATIASKELRSALYGSQHPYGQSQEAETIEGMSLESVVRHYEKFIRSGNAMVVLAGMVHADDIEYVNQYLGQRVIEFHSADEKQFEEPEQKHQNILIEKAESVQSSIRIGRKMFTRNHPDYFKMLVANEILGGYFGSRLMKNIREEKGLTYGISSNVLTLNKDGYFLIGTDVKKEFTQQTIDEIKKEIGILQTELVGDEELQTVKNYMAGEFAGSLNTAFEVADRQKIIITDQLSHDFFSQYIDQIHATTAEDIQYIANTYLQPDEMIEVVVGGK
jgi:zinc protease